MAATGNNSISMAERMPESEVFMKINSKSCMARGLAMVALAGMLAGVGSMPVMAQYNKEEAQEVPEVVSEEKPDGTPFSVKGNGEVLDDISNDETKQFITVRTKNNQTFFVVIDRANSVDNVYMLSMIDEDDLSEFLEEQETDSIAGVQIPEETEKLQETEQEVTESVEEEKKSGGSWGMLLAAAGFVGLFGAGYYYFKIYKSGQKKNMNLTPADQDEDYDEDDEYEDEDGYEDDESDYEELEYDDEEYEDDEYEADDEADEEDDPGMEDEDSDYADDAEADPGTESETAASVTEGDMTEDYYEEEEEEQEEAPRKRRSRRRKKK